MTQCKATDAYLRQWPNEDHRPVIDVGSTNPFPGGGLSNFTMCLFRVDYMFCASMESFLQSLKFEDPKEQAQVWRLGARDAKREGRKRDSAWKSAQTLWWKGKPIRRDGVEYQKLLDDAYLRLMAWSPVMDWRLRCTGDAILTHTIGKWDMRDTVLTVPEFCGRLLLLREALR